MGFFDGFAGDLFGGALSLFGGERANASSARMAQNQMDFQERMDNSKYQRSVKDLMAAGLNPMLAYTNGVGAAPGGASAPQSDTITPAINTALAARRNRAEVQNMLETNSQIKSQTAANLALAIKYKADSELSSASAQNANITNDLLKTQVPGAKNRAAAEKSPIGKYGAYFDRLMDSIGRLNPFANSASSVKNSFGK